MHSTYKYSYQRQKLQGGGKREREILVTGSVSVIQLERFLEKAVKPGIEK